MNLNDVKALGLKNKTRTRVGRGIGSGHGKTSGRGHKGAKSRSGWSSRIGWEGGQMPLYRRAPKRGFNNKNFKKFFTIINVGDLASFAAGTVIDLKSVLEAGLASKEKHTEQLKVLGNGEVTRNLVLKVNAITTTARQKIEAAGGKVELIPEVIHRPKFTRKGETTPRPKGNSKVVGSSKVVNGKPPAAKK